MGAAAFRNQRGFMQAVVQYPEAFQAEIPVIECKTCASRRVVRFGVTEKGNQRYRCKSCGRTMLDNDAPARMRYSADAIALALDQFYQASSLQATRRRLETETGEAPDPSNIYRWILKYTRAAVEALESLPVRAGKTWVADETVCRMKGGRLARFFDCLDLESRFLLASHLPDAPHSREIDLLLEAARHGAGRAPEVVITDTLGMRLKTTRSPFAVRSRSEYAGEHAVPPSPAADEWFQGMLQQRTKVVRALAQRENAVLAMKGWRVHYNFFRPHPGLGGRVPAEAAGVERLPFRSWSDVVTKSDSSIDLALQDHTAEPGRRSP